MEGQASAPSACEQARCVLLVDVNWLLPFAQQRLIVVAASWGLVWAPVMHIVMTRRCCGVHRRLSS